MGSCLGFVVGVGESYHVRSTGGGRLEIDPFSGGEATKRIQRYLAFILIGRDAHTSISAWLHFGCIPSAWMHVGFLGVRWARACFSAIRAGRNWTGLTHAARRAKWLRQKLGRRGDSQAKCCIANIFSPRRICGQGFVVSMRTTCFARAAAVLASTSFQPQSYLAVSVPRTTIHSSVTPGRHVL